MADLGPALLGCKRPLAAGTKMIQGGYLSFMKLRTRKFIGTFGTVFYMIVYALVIMAIGGNFIVGHGAMIELPFYILAGLGWLPIAMMIIRWMSKPD
jgi:Protein of unknown function (DUF2842)